MWFATGRDAREPSADRLRLGEPPVDRGCDTAHRKAQAAELRHDAKHRLVGNIVADEDRAALGKWRVPHQFAYCFGLVDAGRLDFDDEVARQNLNAAGSR